MTLDYQQEFETVNVVIRSAARTCGVDAFALSLIKAERQIRKLVTHLIYQFPCFGPREVQDLRRTLVNNRHVYFEGFEKGFDTLYPHKMCDLIGSDYERLRGRIEKAVDYRNKIFHGQLTEDSLSRADLLGLVADIRLWCKNAADGAFTEFHYDGFGWNSFQKSSIAELSKRFKVQIGSIAEYDAFVRQYMER